MNDSLTRERGFKEVKIQNISRGSMPSLWHNSDDITNVMSRKREKNIKKKSNQKVQIYATQPKGPKLVTQKALRYKPPGTCPWKRPSNTK